MSQRVHTCVNNTNLETIHCDAYSAKLINARVSGNGKTMRMQSTQMQRGGVMTGSGGVNLPATVTRALVPRVGRLPKVEPPCIRKELYTSDNAMVEVTVKTHKARQRSRSDSQTRVKENWGRLLKAQGSNEHVSTFNSFDPLRTVHFLAKELQCKLQSSVPNDHNLQQMLLEMQQALARIPNEIAPNMNTVVQKKIDCPIAPPPTERDIAENSSQTPRSLFVEPEKLQQHLEESSEKIEKACQQMELLCSKLKADKEELERLLKTERETVKALKKQVDEQKVKFSATSALVENLQLKNGDLEAEVCRVKAQHDVAQVQSGPTSQELRQLVQELQRQKSVADEECMVVKQQLTIASMENEKYETILQARDAQVKEIRNEMSQLQQVVNEQLMELQNNPYSSDTSSVSNSTVHPTVAWPDIRDPPSKLTTTSAPMPSKLTTTSGSVDSVQTRQLPHHHHHHHHHALPHDLHSGDTSATTDTPRVLDADMTPASPQKDVKPKKIKKRHEKGGKMTLGMEPDCVPGQMNIRDKFAEIKKQAFLFKPAKLENRE